MTRKRERTSLPEYLGKSIIGMLVQNIVAIVILIVAKLLDNGLLTLIGMIFAGFGLLTALILFAKYFRNVAGSHRIRIAIALLESDIRGYTALIENGAVAHPEIYVADLRNSVIEKLDLEEALRNNERILIEKDDPLFK